MNTDDPPGASPYEVFRDAHPETAGRLASRSQPCPSPRARLMTLSSATAIVDRLH